MRTKTCDRETSFSPSGSVRVDNPQTDDVGVDFLKNRAANAPGTSVALHAAMIPQSHEAPRSHPPLTVLRGPSPIANEPAFPRIVAVGGGTGLPTVLSGLANALRSTTRARDERSFETAISAIVTVTDDGGSSGRLRREL